MGEPVGDVTVAEMIRRLDRLEELTRLEFRDLKKEIRDLPFVSKDTWEAEKAALAQRIDVIEAELTQSIEQVKELHDTHVSGVWRTMTIMATALIGVFLWWLERTYG